MINNKIHEPLFHLTKRNTISQTRAWALRISAFIISFLACAILSVILTEKGFDYYFDKFFLGTFGTPIAIWSMFREMAILLLIALAVTPCFKMKFWNIGGEGQVLMGCLGAAVAIQFMGGKVNDAGTIVVSIILAIAFGTVWAVIPALFKAKWNTNETLLTLMMNYIATCLTLFFIKSVATKQTGILDFTFGLMPSIAGNEYIIDIIVVTIVTIIMAIYLKYSKHGYEIAVVGESPNTAKYVGINTKAVIIRTLVFCGVLCGIAGFLIVSATNHNLSETSVGGRGFTGVLISWLSHFNPLAMVLVSFIVVFIQYGATNFSNYARLGDSYASVMIGIFFLFIIAVEFFVSYKFVFREDIQAKIDAASAKMKVVFSKNKNEEPTPVVEEKTDEEVSEEPSQDEKASDEEDAKEEK